MRALKWIGYLLGGLLCLAVFIFIVVLALSSLRLNRIYNVQPDTVKIPTDAVAIGRGAYLFTSSCAGCHGDNLGGKAVLDDPIIGYLPATNLTTGQGGIGNRYNDETWVRAIRHGIAYDGKPLMIMPSKAYWYFSDEDLGAIIAFLKSAEPVNNDPGAKRLPPIGRMLMMTGAFGDIFAVEIIDHDAPRPAAPQPGVSVEYGDYLVKTGDCSNCHGSALNGSQSTEPGAPFSPNLTPGGKLADWTVEDFISAIRSGVTPEGNPMDPDFMPWEEYARKTDDDLRAIFLYLQSLPSLETGAK